MVFAQGGKKIINTEADTLEYTFPSITEEVRLIGEKEYFFQYPYLGHFAHMTTLYKRKMALELDFYREDISSSDLESLLRLSLHGKVILTKKVFGTWVVHNSNFSQNLSFVDNKKNLLFILNCYDYAKEFSFEHDKLFKWKRYCITKYFEKWLSRIAKSEQTFSSKASNYPTSIRNYGPRVPRSIHQFLFLQNAYCITL